MTPLMQISYVSVRRIEWFMVVIYGQKCKKSLINGPQTWDSPSVAASNRLIRVHSISGDDLFRRTLEEIVSHCENDRTRSLA